MNTSHAEWFSSEGIPYLHTVRGYYMPSYDGSEEYLRYIPTTLKYLISFVIYSSIYSIIFLMSNG